MGLFDKIVSAFGGDLTPGFNLPDQKQFGVKPAPKSSTGFAGSGAVGTGSYGGGGGAAPASGGGGYDIVGDYVGDAPGGPQPGGGVLGASTSRASGSSTPSYSQEDLAYLDSQRSALDRQLGRTDTTLADSLRAVIENYEKELSGANKTQGRNIEDFNTKTQISEQGRSRELGKVDQSSRMLADQLRQKFGLAGGSGSSAYQLAAPRAVQRQASEQRGDVLQDYSANFQALDTDRKRSEQDFAELLQELEAQRTQREGGVRGDIEEQRNSIRENQGRLAGERAKLLGGGYAGVRGAMQPYEDQIRGGESLIDSIYSKYAAKYDVKPLQVNNTNIRDYAVDKTAVRDQQATGSNDPYAPFKKPLQDEEDKLPY